MFGLRRGPGTGVGRQTQRLLAEIASDRRSRSADRFAQGLGSEMAIALRNRHCIGVDDEIVRLVSLRSRERVGRRLRVGQHRGALEVFAPAPISALKHDDTVRETVGGDDVGHAGLTNIGVRRAAYIITTIFNGNDLYVTLYHTTQMSYSTIDRPDKLKAAGSTRPGGACRGRRCCQSSRVDSVTEKPQRLPFTFWRGRRCRCCDLEMQRRDPQGRTSE